ncbi:hypothetical protein DV738_g380, partial [Chaetothyriales sp. CBS 135597]
MQLPSTTIMNGTPTTTAGATTNPTSAPATAASPATTADDGPIKFDTIESAIASFRAGNFLVVLDDESRENEGDLIIAAEDVTTEKMAFMIRYSSGYVCAPLTNAIAEKLKLPLMIGDGASQDPKRTAYCVSVDASEEGVTTGISARDRASTCRTLAGKLSGPADLRRPGHILPLRARDGGVLERQGHTEAAVEFCRLAGKRQVAAIGEIVEDGLAVEGQAVLKGSGMMTRDACLQFGRRFGLKVVTIADLVDYVNKDARNGVSGSAGLLLTVVFLAIPRVTVPSPAASQPMAPLYTSVAQSDHEPAHTSVNPAQSHDAALPELPQISHRPLSADFESLSGEVGVIGGHEGGDDVPPTPKAKRAAGGGFLNSLSSGHSYEMIDEDDYDEPLQATPKGSDPDAPTSATYRAPRVRTASVPRNLPLNHPTPDLHTIQGAYARHVERLEEGAERLSMTSSLQHQGMNEMEKERPSPEPSRNSSLRHTASHTASARQSSVVSPPNSISDKSVKRADGYSPVSPPTGSPRSVSPGSDADSRANSRADSHAHSPSRPLKSSAVQLPEPDYEGNPLEFGEEPARPVPGVVAFQNEMGVLTDPFADFDGVYHGRPSLDGSLRQLSLSHPPLARDSKAFREAQPGETMVFYPAPVPVMLNLPPRLSKISIAEREKRRMQALSGVPEELRKSAAWLKNMPPSADLREREVKLPPQLRASAFFDGPSTSTSLKPTDGSAVQTLDAILDASAYAPVSAFTDHPIAGRVGHEVYGPERHSRKTSQGTRNSMLKGRRRSSMSTLLRLRRSSDPLIDGRQSRVVSGEYNVHDAGEDEGPRDDQERAAAESIAPGDDELVHDRDNEGKGEADDGDAQSTHSEHQLGFSGAPTTLLAELQLRKAQLKSRNRTAADAFPQGMHSTLLELDAVAQLQQRARQTKHVTLAWEDQKAAEQENFADEDIPLGMLFAEKGRGTLLNVNRPLGLMEKREIEENEPLSIRRARLRGETYQPPGRELEPTPAEEQPEPKFKLDLPGSQDIEEQEGETLAQRRKRMKEEKEKATVGNFASEAVSELGLEAPKEPAPPPPPPAPSKTPDAEETLGQRRKRLKEEALKAGANPAGELRPALRTSHSMATILQAYPNGQRQLSGGSVQSLPQQQTAWATGLVPNPLQVDIRSSAIPQIPAHMQGLPYYNQASLTQPQYNPSQAMMYGYPGMGQMAAQPMAMNGMPYAQYGQYAQYGMMPSMLGPPLTTQQRAMIDRWRQGIA